MSDSTGILLSDAGEEAYRRARLRWQWALTTPLVYMAFAFWIRGKGIAEPEESWDGPAWRGMMGGAAAGLALAALAIRRRQRLRAEDLRFDPRAKLSRWMIDFYVLAGVADVIAVLGTVDALASGREMSLLAGGAAAYAAYALAHPRRSDLAAIEATPVPHRDW